MRVTAEHSRKCYAEACASLGFSLGRADEKQWLEMRGGEEE